MAKRVTGPEIEKLIQLLAKVPGLGPRSARRAALHLIKKKDQLMGPLAHAMGDAFDNGPSNWSFFLTSVSAARRAERGPSPGTFARSWISFSISGPVTRFAMVSFYPI